jgi:hypothetical protein
VNALELESALRKARNTAEKTLWFGAILASELGQDVVIVGGSAIEIYTSGWYVSGDIDLVGERNAIIKILERWEFLKSGRMWSRVDLGLWVDPVARDYTGDTRKLQEVATPYGRVKLASLEDLIAKRLIETKVWPRGGTELFDQALALANEYDGQIDWDYVTKVATRDLAGDLVPELRRRITRGVRRRG